MLHVAKSTQFVTGLPGKKGDPSPVTAYGVYMGMKAAAKFKYGKDSLNGKKIAVQGIGHVGDYLLQYLHCSIVDITCHFHDFLRGNIVNFCITIHHTTCIN